MFDFTQANKLYGTKFDLNNNIYDIVNGLDKVYEKLGYNEQQKMIELQKVFRMSTPEIERMVGQVKRFDEILSTVNPSDTFEQATENAKKLSAVLQDVSDALLTGFQTGVLKELGLDIDHLKPEKIAKMVTELKNMADTFGHLAGMALKIAKVLWDNKWAWPLLGSLVGLVYGGPYGALAGAVIGFGAGYAAIDAENETLNETGKDLNNNWSYAQPQENNEETGLKLGTVTVNQKTYINGVELKTAKTETATHLSTSNQRNE